MELSNVCIIDTSGKQEMKQPEDQLRVVIKCKCL